MGEVLAPFHEGLGSFWKAELTDQHALHHGSGASVKKATGEAYDG